MKRAKFSLSNTKLLSCNMGTLIPIGWYEALPGDTIQQATSALVRAAPLVAPVMHPVQVRIHHWFVPNRLLWKYSSEADADDQNAWEAFITGGADGMNTSTPPYINVNSAVAVGSLLDYLGVPPADYTGKSLHVSALPVRAYQKIFNEWYRDQDLVAQAAIDYDEGADSTTSLTLNNAAWEKDYYTSSRPWEQKGPSVTVPLGTQANVRRFENAVGPQQVIEGGSNTLSPINQVIGVSSSTPGSLMRGNTATTLNNPVNIDPNGTLYADLSGASAVTVNVLREALAIQRYEEARARYGSRYTEYLRYLGVRSSDARLQRPEYLGGGRQTIQFSEVLQTTPGDGSSADTVGALKGHGITALRSNRYRRFFEEHGIVMSLMSVRPKTIYASGLPKKFSRTVKEDYWQREFEHIGQQEVLNKEIYAQSSTPTAVFGYQDRYDEYRREESSIAGEFRSVLDYWHLARIFASQPALNSDFVQCVPTERVFADNADNVLYVMASHSIQARRMVAGKGTSFIF